MTSKLFELEYFTTATGKVYMKKSAFVDAMKQHYPEARIYQHLSNLKVVFKVTETLEATFNCHMIKSFMGRVFFVNDLEAASHLKLDQYTLSNFNFRGKGARDPNIAWKFADEFHKAMMLEVDEQHGIYEADGDEYNYETQKNFD